MGPPQSLLARPSVTQLPDLLHGQERQAEDAIYDSESMRPRQAARLSEAVGVGFRFTDQGLSFPDRIP